MDAIGVLIYLLVFVLIVWLAFAIADRAFPAQVAQIARIVIGLIALVVVLSYLAGGISLPAIHFGRLR